MEVFVQEADRTLAEHFGCRRVVVLLQADTEQLLTSPRWFWLAFNIGNIVFGVTLAMYLADSKCAPAPAVAGLVQIYLEVAGSRQKLFTRSQKH